MAVISKYPRFSVSKEKDIYKELHEYSLMISDYSSIVYDYLILDRPIVFFAFDDDIEILNKKSYNELIV